MNEIVVFPAIMFFWCHVDVSSKPVFQLCFGILCFVVFFGFLFLEVGMFSVLSFCCVFPYQETNPQTLELGKNAT